MTTSTTVLKDIYKLEKGLTYRLNSGTLDYQHNSIKRYIQIRQRTHIQTQLRYTRLPAQTVLKDTYKLDKGLTYRLNSGTLDYQHNSIRRYIQIGQRTLIQTQLRYTRLPAQTVLEDTYKLDKGLTYRFNSGTLDY